MHIVSAHILVHIAKFRKENSKISHDDLAALPYTLGHNHTVVSPLFIETGSGEPKSNVAKKETSNTGGIPIVVGSPPPTRRQINFEQEVLDISETMVRKTTRPCLERCHRSEKVRQLVETPTIKSLVESVDSFLEHVCLTSGRYGSPMQLPPVLHVYGPSGTGKTMTVKECCRKIPRCTYINCVSFQGKSKSDSIVYILDQMRTTAKQLKRNKSGKQQQTSLLVLDEIDKVVDLKVRGGDGTAHGVVLRKIITNWAAALGTILSVIAISNSVTLRPASSLLSIGLVSTTHDVNNYTFPN